ncbi:hypothetical protein [Tepidibacter sp. Z1-5]|uniref:hypothetical protein n=1 Tax=Tepidibacter sp. Z1-5 TaxID=3134138 RepID=UPI0030C1FB25
MKELKMNEMMEVNGGNARDFCTGVGGTVGGAAGAAAGGYFGGPRGAAGGLVIGGGIGSSAAGDMYDSIANGNYKNVKYKHSNRTFPVGSMQ